MSGGLRVAVTVDPYLPVPPVLYGGIERAVHVLLEGLVSRGHYPTLFAHPSSQVRSVPLVPYGVPPHTGLARRAAELAQLGSALWRRRGEFDVIHSFGRLAALVPVLPIQRLPKVQSYQRVVPWEGVRRAVRLAGGSVSFTACSDAQCQAHRGDPAYGAWSTIFNGVPMPSYRFVTDVPPDAPLVFLGRLDPIKGAHHAIDIAVRSGRRLILAGPKSFDGPDTSYFDERIAPYVDGDRIQYVGPVNDEAKNALLGSSAALLMPIECEEAFGIVMAEALACGTPVIGFRRGSVPEVVQDGLTGFVCDTPEQAAAAVGRIGSLDRRAARRACEARYSADAVVDQYVQLYSRVCRQQPFA